MKQTTQGWIPEHFPAAPLFVLTGGESLLVWELCRALRTHLFGLGFEERRLWVAENDTDWNQMPQGEQSGSLFSVKNLSHVLVPGGKVSAKCERWLKQFLSLGGLSSAHHVLIIEAPMELSLRDPPRWLIEAEKKGCWIHVKTPLPRQFEAWLDQRIQQNHLVFEPDAYGIFFAAVANNFLVAHQLIQHLSLWTLESKTIITAAMIKTLVTTHAHFDCFALADAAIAAQPEQAWQRLHALRVEDTPEVLILWALRRTLQQVARLSEVLEKGQTLHQAIKEEKVWQHRAPAMEKALGRYSSNQWRLWCHKAYLLEQQIKNVRATTWPGDLMLGLTMSIAGLEMPPWQLHDHD